MAHVNTSQARTGVVAMQTNRGFIAVAAARGWLLWDYTHKPQSCVIPAGFSLLRSWEESVACCQGAVGRLGRGKGWDGLG